MKTFFLASALLLGFTAPALAAPTYDPATHPLIDMVRTEKATYKPGDSGNVVVVLRNTTGSAFSGTLATRIYLNSNGIDLPGTAVSLEAGAQTTINVPFTITNTGEKGYLVNAVLTASGGAIADAAAGAIDVQNTPINGKYPRQCWVSKATPGMNVSAQVTSLLNWRCNSIQAYDVYYRPELAPPPNLASWPALNNDTVSRTTIENLISSAHSANMAVGFFQATGEAYSNFTQQAVKPSLAWGSFRNRCGLTGSCTESDLDRSPQAPDNWTQFGWQADHLDFFNPCNPGWQNFLVGKSIRPMMQQFAFDFWQADTVGEPPQPTYDYRGNPLATQACLSGLTNQAASALRKPVILNMVSGFGQVVTASNTQQPYLYRETWNFDTPYVPGINSLLYDDFGIRRYSTRPVLTPAYINRTLASGCAAGTITSGCAVNANSSRIATAIFAIAGTSLMNHADEICVLTNVYVPGSHLPCSASTAQRLLDYKAFEVGYQHLLRDGAGNAPEAALLSGSGVVQSTVGAANAVYSVAKTKAGYQILHFLNQTGVTVNDWTDLDGNKQTPTALTNIAVKMYYVGNVVVPGTNRLWWATPDSENGAPRSLSYTAGTDVGGNFITFAVPALSVWDMIVLETSVVDVNGNISARQPIRGGWYTTASSGVSYGVGSAVVAPGSGLWAAYRGVDFTSTSPTSVTVTYRSLAPTAVSYMLDGPTGAPIAACNLPSSGGATVTYTCPVTNATGLRTLAVRFNNQAITLFSTQFN